MYAGGWGEGLPGFVLASNAARETLRCSYPYDGATQDKTCVPTSPSDDSCIPGCMHASTATMGVSGWCGTAHPENVSVPLESPGWLQDPATCPYAPTDLQAMMEKQLQLEAGFGGCECCRWPACPRYNELVLSDTGWTARLPTIIEAIYFPVGRNRSAAMEKYAKKVQAAFRLAFPNSQHAQNVPVLALNLTRSRHPFSLVKAAS
jgi:hypothetical protein